jgi:phosphoribosylaminoimidazolecarboxamide formyltransferase/IMP cyclohydrolase
MIEIKRALLSCWDKQGLAEFAGALAGFNVEIISSGGTAAFLESHQIPVMRVEAITGYPEVLGGRVKTLHPMIHAAILAKDTPEHAADLEKLGVEPLQLVVVNLYPFVDKAVQKNLSPEEAVEYIDIGGPALLRAAAKNFQYTAALYRPDQYGEFLHHIRQNRGKFSESYSQQLARKVFFYTAWYDGKIQEYFSQDETVDQALPQYQTFFLEKKQELRYGENPHQQAAVYRPFGEAASGLAALEQLGGKALSYNNYLDVQAAYALVQEFAETAAAIIKHTNPCGAALSKDRPAEAFQKALRGDPLSAFGGITAFNRPVDEETALLASEIFLECVIAPDFETPALDILQKKKNLRLLKMDPQTFAGEGYELKMFNNTFLVQESDALWEKPENWKVVTRKSPRDEDWAELEFAWKVAKHVKSNAIVLTKNCEVYGVGAGQMSRIDAVKLARMKAQQAKRELSGLALASDAFFPFRDGIDEAVNAGVSVIIQPGGSIRDEEVIQAANEHNIAMIFTGARHFKH